MFIRANEKYEFWGKQLGAVYYNYEDRGIYLVDRVGSGGRRKVYWFDTSENKLEESFFLNTGQYNIKNHAHVSSAVFFSGEIGLLIDHTASVTGGKARHITRIIWFNDDGSAVSPPAYNDLYSPLSSFALRHYYGNVRTFFFQDAPSGAMMRWPQGGFPPASTYDFIPWRTRYGEVMGMDFWDKESVSDPKTHLVTAQSNGLIVWSDISNWGGEGYGAYAEEYKRFGCIEAKEINDIAIDRNENKLYVLNKFNQLLIYNLEPFADEAVGYVNTPKSLILVPEFKEIAPGSQMDVFGMATDMWEQLIEAEDIEINFISGSALGKFYDHASNEFRPSTTVMTAANGIATARYRANTQKENEGERS